MLKMIWGFRSQKICIAYPNISDGNFKGALWNLNQWLALKMRVHYGISIVLLWSD